MTLPIEIGGRVRQVSVERLDSSGRVRFTIDDEVLDVNAAAVDEDSWSLLLSDGSQHLVRVSGTPAAGFTVHTTGGDVAVTIPGNRPRGRRPGAEADSSQPARILATMPGKIVRVLAAMGQEVRAGQGIVVVEAMKMENELRTPRGGVVKEIRAVEGTTVDAGALLAVIE